MQIRRANEVDLEAMWGIFQAVVVTGDTLPFSDATDKEVFRAHWFGVGQSTFVAKVDSRIFGMYTLGANYPDLGSHVASATYLVSPEAQGLVITQYFRDSRLLLSSGSRYGPAPLPGREGNNDGLSGGWRHRLISAAPPAQN